MLIPKYWAHYNQCFKSSATVDNLPKQATIKRYGWSDSSQAEALAHAKARVEEAHHRWLAGVDIMRREPDERYNERSGIPIREQILSEPDFSKQTSSKSSAAPRLVVTRNSYGAQVANINNIAIIDVDNTDLFRKLYPDDYLIDSFTGTCSDLSAQKSNSMTGQIWGFIIVCVLLASIIALQGWSWLWLIVVMLVATAFLWQKASKQERAQQQKQAADLASLLPFMTELIQNRITQYPNEGFRLYATPAGFRIIATHATILPNDTLVNEWFTYFYADANYVRLCQLQQCFRARLTAKPWRMREVTAQKKLAKDIPTKDFWSQPTEDEDAPDTAPRYAKIAARAHWLEDYDTFAKGYRACRYVASFEGSEARNNKPMPAAIYEFIVWHDGACQVNQDLPLA